MTVPSEVSEVAYTGNAVTTVFAVPFPFLANADIDVTLLLSGETVPVVQVLTTHYTLTGAGAASGTVTMLVAPPAASTLNISRTEPITQTAFDAVTQGPFSPAAHEAALDKRCRVEQQLARRMTQMDEACVDVLARIAVLESGL